MSDIQKVKTEIVSHPVSASGSQMVTMPNQEKNTENQYEDLKADKGAQLGVLLIDSKRQNEEEAKALLKKNLQARRMASLPDNPAEMYDSYGEIVM